MKPSSELIEFINTYVDASEPGYWRYTFNSIVGICLILAIVINTFSYCKKYQIDNNNNVQFVVDDNVIDERVDTILLNFCQDLVRFINILYNILQNFVTNIRETNYQQLSQNVSDEEKGEL
jgi:hypothetical protein